MISSRFLTTYVLLLICQMLMCNYLNFSPLTYVAILPVMIMCIPLEVGTILTMLIAFFSGLLVDIAADSVIGLNAFALVPVALIRSTLMQVLFGTTPSRREKFDFQTRGFWRVSLVVFIGLTIFLTLYIWADGAGLHNFGFNFLRYICSLLLSYVFSLVAVSYFSPKE